MNRTSRRTLFTFMNKLVVSAIMFINSVLAARYLNIRDRGYFQFSGTITQAGNTFMGGYFGYYGWALAKRPEDTVPIVQMGNLFAAGVSILVWVVAFAMRAALPFHIPLQWWWAILCLPFSFLYNYGTRLLQGVNAIGWLNRANTLQPVLFLVIYVLIQLQRHLPMRIRLDYTFVIWVGSYGIAAIATLIVAYWQLHKAGSVRWRFWPNEWRGNLNYGSWLSVSQLVSNVNYRMDLWWIFFFLPIHIASQYGIAVTAAEVLNQISGSVASVVYTRMSGSSRRDAIEVTELAVRHTFISSCIVAVGMYIAFPWLIVTAFTHKYALSIVPFLILLPGLIAKATSNMLIQYATNQLGSPRTAIWMNGMSAVINAVFCVLLIPHFALAGGALASTISYVVSYGVYIVWFARLNQVSARNLLVIRKSDIEPYVHVITSFFRRRRAS